MASVFDRRRVYIELTTAGEDVRDHAEDQLAKRFDDLLAKLSDEEIASLEEGLRVMEKVMASVEPRRSKPVIKPGYGS